MGGDPIRPTRTDAGSPNRPEASTPDPGGPGSGLPCEVQGVIEKRCIVCHRDSSPPPLRTYDDLIAKSPTNPTKTMAEMAIEEMKAERMPPPPARSPEDDEILAFETWVNGGTKRNPVSCTAPSDAGTGTDAGGGGGQGKCTSGETWTGGDNGSPLMHPGAACNGCHQVSGGPSFRVAGTVFPTLHEPIDCNGSGTNPPLTVGILDADGNTTAMSVNEAGNFYTTETLTFPLRVAVYDGNSTRVMRGTVPSGDCNSCHTAKGNNGAPGRIMPP
jgi:mono/diheme cytochrome c family protein